MKILMTGISGYIGSHLAYKLKKTGHEVHGIIRNPLTDESRVRLLNGMPLHYHNNNNLSEIVKTARPDAVIHLASLYLTTHRSDQVEELIRSNIEFPSKLLDAMSECGVKMFINTGTSWQNYNSSDYEPANLYAATKQGFESVLKFYTSALSLKALTLRLFDSYGPDDNRGKLISLFDKLSSNGHTLGMSPGEQIIKLVHIDDICDAFSIALTKLTKENEGYNEVFGVDANEGNKIIDLVKLYEKVNSCKLNIQWGEKPYREREVMVPCENLQNLPDWHPKIALQDGLRKENRNVFDC